MHSGGSCSIHSSVLCSQKTRDSFVPGDLHPALKASQALVVIKSPAQIGQVAGLMKLYFSQDGLAEENNIKCTIYCALKMSQKDLKSQFEVKPCSTSCVMDE